MTAPLSEDSILACLAQYFPDSHPSLLVGRGDDCAIVRQQNAQCISTDLFLEDIHFRRSYFSPAEIGYKALAVNISDIAACGGRPACFTLGLGLPQGIDLPWLDSFFSGMGNLAAKHRMALVGGDLSRAPALHICITVWGDVQPDCLLTRGNGMVGDALFVVGALGLARVGLAVLEAEGNAARVHWPAACAAHLTPVPQVDAGIMLARAGRNARPPALMDISDGLARDLPRLLGMSPGLATMQGKSLGAELVLPQGMLPPEVVRYATKHHLNPVHEALRGGEDYALLGCCAQDMLPPLQLALPRLMPIGIVTNSGQIMCNGLPLGHIQGFDHFS